jgi:hypothetical protein
MTKLETIQDVIAALGGPSDLAEMLDVTQQAVSMWKVRGEIPAGWHYRLHIEALRRGYEIDPSVFGMVDPFVRSATSEVHAVA